MTPAIETNGLSKRYRHVTALADCPISVPVGRISALIGPNEAGKTTLLRLRLSTTLHDRCCSQAGIPFAISALD